MLIDRDRKPQWRPATLAEITDSMIDTYFTPIGDRELRFD
jgi:enoyl-CoA hydratase